MFGYKLNPTLLERCHVVNLAVGDALPKRGNYATRTIAQFILALLGWQIEGDIPNLPKIVFIGAPHSSNWDMALGMVVIWALGLRVYWFAKHTLFPWPIGGFFRWLGGIPIDRQTSHGVVNQMVGEYERQDKYLLTILPKGTRAKGAKWKSGFYHIAWHADAPIVPVAFDYGRKVVTFGPTFHPTGNIVADMDRLQSHFAGVQPCRGDNEYSA